MNVKALVLTGVTTGLAVVTLVALNLIAPITHADDRHEPGITADQVFGASIAEPGAGAASGEMEVAALDSPAPVSAAPEAAPVSEPATAGGSCALDASSAGGAAAATTLTAVSEAPAEMEVAQAEPESFAAAEAPAAEAAPEPAYAEPAAAMEEASTPIDGAPTVAAGSCSTGVTDPSQKPVVVMAGGLPDSPAAPAAEAAASEPVAFESAPVAEAPAPEPAAAPAVEYVPEPEPVVAAAPAPKPAVAAPSKPKAPVQKVPKVQPEETKAVWWPAQQSGKLNITYAGNVSFTKAIAIVTDGAHIDGAKANEHIKVTTKSGKAVPGQWLVAKGNPQMLLYSVPPGVYKVTVGQGMSDRGNRTMPNEASGLVWVP